MQRRIKYMRLFVLSALSVLSLQIASPVWAKNCKNTENDFKEIKIKNENEIRSGSDNSVYLNKLKPLIANLERQKSDDSICKNTLKEAQELSNKLSADITGDSKQSSSKSSELTPLKSTKSQLESNVNQLDSNWLGWLNLALIILAAGAGAVYAVRFNNISKRIERKINSLEMKNCELSNSVNKHSSALDNLLNSRKSIPSASTNNLSTDISKSSPDFKQENVNVRDFIFPFDKERMTSQSVKQEDSLLDYYNYVLSADGSNFDRQQQIKQNWPENVRMSVRNLEDFLERRGAELELEESNDGYFFALSENSYTAVFPIPGKSIAIDPVKEVFDIQGDGSSLKRVARAARFIHNSNAILTLSEKGLIITN